MKLRDMLLAFVFLLCALVPATAADPPTATILHKSTRLFYAFQGSSNYIYFVATSWQNPNEARQADLSFFLYDWTESSEKLLDAYGSIPSSMMTITGQTVRVIIPDLRQLVGPDFFIGSEINMVAPIAIDCTFTTTPKLIDEITDKFTERDDLPDGRVIITKQFAKSTQYTAAASGQIAGYTLPQFEAPWNYGDTWIMTGDTKSHRTPAFWH